MANNYFQFKQFKIVQQNSAMKVGTDGVLIGAWTWVKNTKSVLDVGTGTGLIALMLAQRSEAKIVGIEIEKAAAGEAKGNVNNSPWAKRIQIENISFQEFANLSNNSFDLIISNPPFFTGSRKNQNSKRTLARHNDSLPYADLITGALKLLNKTGRLSVILPVSEAEEFIKLAERKKLFLIRRTQVKPKESKSPNRILMELSPTFSKRTENSLTIYLNDSSGYTNNFKQLIQDFYLSV